ncbi:MAG TPA: carboxypeptidase-like regulatory domain-containing protein, partial [Acidobacteriaceae bacterium]
MVLRRKRESRERFANLCACVMWAACGLGVVCGVVAEAQSWTDGAIGGRVLDVAGVPVAGAAMVARDVETGFVLRTRSGGHGEFLLVRLPVGDYALTAEVAGVVLTLPEPVAVVLGDVTEVEVRMSLPGAGVQAPDDTPEAGSIVTEAQLATLPIDGGDWRASVLAAAGASNGAGDEDSSDDLSFRGIALSQNSLSGDGTSGDESFSGTRVGSGVNEDADAGSDEVTDRSAGVGSGSRSVTDGGQRVGSSYAFSRAAVREFRVGGQSDAAQYGSALYGHGVGGVVTSVSRSGGTTLHGMMFYTLRESGWAAMNPFSVASAYANGVVTNTLVKPKDVRQQFGGRVGGPMPWLSGDRARTTADARRGLFYFYAFDAQRRDFPAISAPGYA